jgi:hypothetical protein
MSEVAIFSFGSVMFIATSWATIAFGLRRIAELQAADLQDSGMVPESRDDGLTEIHVSVSDGVEPATDVTKRS